MSNIIKVWKRNLLVYFDQDTMANFSLLFATLLLFIYSAIIEYLLYSRHCFRTWEYKVNALLYHSQWNSNCITQ